MNFHFSGGKVKALLGHALPHPQLGSEGADILLWSSSLEDPPHFALPSPRLQGLWAGTAYRAVSFLPRSPDCCAPSTQPQPSFVTLPPASLQPLVIQTASASLSRPTRLPFSSSRARCSSHSRLCGLGKGRAAGCLITIKR